MLAEKADDTSERLAWNILTHVPVVSPSRPFLFPTQY
jgi:hypothetical protein